VHCGRDYRAPGSYATPRPYGTPRSYRAPAAYGPGACLVVGAEILGAVTHVDEAELIAFVDRLGPRLTSPTPLTRHWQQAGGVSLRGTRVLQSTQRQKGVRGRWQARRTRRQAEAAVVAAKSSAAAAAAAATVAAAAAAADRAAAAAGPRAERAPGGLPQSWLPLWSRVRSSLLPPCPQRGPPPRVRQQAGSSEAVELYSSAPGAQHGRHGLVSDVWGVNLSTVMRVCKRGHVRAGAAAGGKVAWAA